MVIATRVGYFCPVTTARPESRNSFMFFLHQKEKASPLN